MEKTKITVYIPSRNYGRYLQDSIESVLKQTIDGWELLLINDASTDNSRDIMELYKNDPRVRIFDTQDIGLPAVANLALKEAKGEYIIRLDADDVWDENILLVLSNFLDRNPDIALVFPDYFLVDDFGGIIRYEGRQTMYQYNHLMDMPANGACTLVRKKVVENLGGYREDLGAQDGFDLWTKVMRDYKCANVSIPLFYYRRHGKNLTDNNVRILSARRAIKKDACEKKIQDGRPILGIIPCRESYDIFPNMWKMPINGKTLLDVAIETCSKSKLFDKIIVASDTAEVRDVMSGHDDPRLTFFQRTKESTSYSRSIVDTLEAIIKEMELNFQGISVLSYVQTPFTTTASLEEAVYTLLLNDADSAFAVEEINQFLYSRTPHGLTPITPQGRMKSDFDVVYAASSSATATRNSNLKTGSLTGPRISHFVVPKEEAFFISTKTDYNVAEILMKERENAKDRNVPVK